MPLVGEGRGGEREVERVGKKEEGKEGGKEKEKKERKGKEGKGKGKRRKERGRDKLGECWNVCRFGFD